MNDQESLLAAIDEPVHLQPYDAKWPEQFALEHNRLTLCMPGKFIEIQHIGSTAIDGLAAKPVIDLLAGVESMAVADALAETICSMGYTTSADFNSKLKDRKWFMRHANGRRTHHLHLVVYGEQCWLEHLRFRDILRASSSLTQRYTALKTQLADQYASDREAYTAAKAEFIRFVLEAAQ